MDQCPSPLVFVFYFIVTGVVPAATYFSNSVKFLFASYSPIPQSQPISNAIPLFKEQISRFSVTLNL